MKKAISIILALLMICSLSATAFAADNGVACGFDTAEELPIATQGYRTLQLNEAVEDLMEKADYSYLDAQQLVDAYSTRGVTLGERWVKYDAGKGYTIEVGCLVEIECGSGHCNFGDIIEKWSKAAGSGDYVWDDFYTYAEVGPPYKTSIRFRTRGNLEVTVSASSSAGFEAAGFSLVGSVSTSRIYRKTISVDKTWTVGDPLE